MDIQVVDWHTNNNVNLIQTQIININNLNEPITIFFGKHN